MHQLAAFPQGNRNFFRNVRPAHRIPYQPCCPAYSVLWITSASAV